DRCWRTHGRFGPCEGGWFHLNHRPPAPKFFWQTGTRQSAPVRASLKLTSTVGFRLAGGQLRLVRTSVDSSVAIPVFRVVTSQVAAHYVTNHGHRAPPRSESRNSCGYVPLSTRTSPTFPETERALQIFLGTVFRVRADRNPLAAGISLLRL